MENPEKIERAGRVVAAHGRRVVVEDDSGGRRSCRMYGRRLRAVCGDRVRWVAEEAEGAEGLVTAVEPRRSELARISAGGDSLTHCAECDEPIPEARRAALPGVTLCRDCQTERDAALRKGRAAEGAQKVVDPAPEIHRFAVGDKVGLPARRPRRLAGRIRQRVTYWVTQWIGRGGVRYW